MSNIFNHLWESYIAITPVAKEIREQFELKGERVKNDHIAFRTFNHPKINIEVLANHFLKIGYVEKGHYFFEKKKLRAKHYEHATDIEMPKIFISELLVEEFSEELQTTISNILNQIGDHITKDQSFVYSGRPWESPSYKTYKALLKESEYAAWLYVFGFTPNHFTINVNALNSFKTLSEVNTFLKQNGHQLNSSGGEIKGSQDVLLEQSSTLAEKIDVKFKGSTHKIPSCYYEFAKRYKNKDGQLFTGFIASSADKIFESTFVSLQR